MADSCVPQTQDMPMCERKDLLDKLQDMVNELERTQNSTKQMPRVLIRSAVCECNKFGKECNYDIQKERARNKMPPQYFDFPREKSETPIVSSKKEGPKEERPTPGPAGDSCVNKPSGNSPKCQGEETGASPLGANKPANSGDQNMKHDSKPMPSKEEGESSCVKRKSKKEPLCGETPLPEERKIDGPHPLIPVPKPHTYELRASKMIVGCDCLRRNGMQHDCQRSKCQGKKECLKFPAPVCQPSGLAPPVIKVSPIIVVDEPDCGPKREKEKTKTQIEQRKILLNYARAQFQDNPPRAVGGSVPCKRHKKEQPLVNISEPVVARTLSPAAWTGTTLVNAGVALTLIMAVLASACLGLQYVYRYHKYQLAAHDDQDSFGGDSCGSIFVGRSRATSNTTLLSEVISLHRFRSQKHSRLNEEENEQLTKEKEEDEGEGEGGEENEGENKKCSSGGTDESKSEPLLAQSADSEKRPTSLEVPRTPQLPRRQLRLLKNRKFMSPVSPVAEEEDGTIPRIQRQRTSSGRPSASSSQSSTLTNGSSPPSLLGVTSKESKEKRNRERMLAGSEFSLTAPDLELDYYDYNVQNAEPGSYLSMDPAFCLWIPPFAPGVWNEEIELVETGDPYKSCESVCDKTSTLIRSVSNRALHMYATEDDSCMNLVEKAPDSPVKVHQPYRVKEKETRVEKSPSDAGSEYYDLLENEGGIKFADEDEEALKEDSPEKKVDIDDNKSKNTVIVEVHSKNVLYKKK